MLPQQLLYQLLKPLVSGEQVFSIGTLLLRQFTQVGATAQNLSLTGTSNLIFGPSSSFDGDVTTSSPSLFFHGCTFNNIVNSIKTGITNDASNGNNVFNGAVTMTNAGAGYLLFGNGNSDQFNTTATFNNTGSSSIYVAYNSANNIFGGVTTFNNAPTANTLIYVSWLSTERSLMIILWLLLQMDKAFSFVVEMLQLQPLYLLLNH